MNRLTKCIIGPLIIIGMLVFNTGAFGQLHSYKSASKAGFLIGAELKDDVGWNKEIRGYVQQYRYSITGSATIYYEIFNKHGKSLGTVNATTSRLGGGNWFWKISVSYKTETIQFKQLTVGNIYYTRQ